MSSTKGKVVPHYLPQPTHFRYPIVLRQPTLWLDWGKQIPSPQVETDEQGILNESKSQRQKNLR
jgi:hypothetical protein